MQIPCHCPPHPEFGQVRACPHLRDYPSHGQRLEKGIAKNSSQSVIYRHIFGKYPFFCAELLAYGGRLVYNVSIDEGGLGLWICVLLSYKS